MLLGLQPRTGPGEIFVFSKFRATTGKNSDSTSEIHVNMDERY
jgi:hypothetical protein